MQSKVERNAVCVAAVLRHPENPGLVYMHRRVKTSKIEQGFWMFPCGGVEIGEGPPAAMIREVLEETGVVPSSFHFLCAEHGIINNISWYCFVFDVSSFEGTPRIMEPDKHCEDIWVDPLYALDEMSDVSLICRPALIRAADKVRSYYHKTHETPK